MKYTRQQVADMAAYMREDMPEDTRHYKAGDMIETLAAELEAAEKRCLTDSEVNTLRSIEGAIAAGLKTHTHSPNHDSLKSMLDRIALQPIVWLTTPRRKAFYAEHHGYTLNVDACSSEDRCFWYIYGKSDGQSGCEPTMEAAKAAAEAWARSH